MKFCAKEKLFDLDCALQIYQCLTGNINSPQSQNVSIPAGFRDALYHYNAGRTNNQTAKDLYSLGDFSYFSESAYHMENWQYRYWGENYEKLKQIKKKYDPDQVFSCYHCVESDLSSGSSLSPLALGLIIGGSVLILIGVVGIIIYSVKKKRNNLQHELLSNE